MLGVVCLIAPLLWALGALLCCCVQSCRHAVPAPVYPAPRTRVRKTKAVLFLLGCAAIAGAACVWSAGGKLRATLLDILVRAPRRVGYTLGAHNITRSAAPTDYSSRAARHLRSWAPRRRT